MRSQCLYSIPLLCLHVAHWYLCGWLRAVMRQTPCNICDSFSIRCMEKTNMHMLRHQHLEDGHSALCSYLGSTDMSAAHPAAPARWGGGNGGRWGKWESCWHHIVYNPYFSIWELFYVIEPLSISETFKHAFQTGESRFFFSKLAIFLR